MPASYADWCAQELRDRRQLVVMGHVNQPGVYRVPRSGSLAHAILAAGGFHDFSDARHIRITRSGVASKHSLLKHREKDFVSPQVEIGDYIRVPLRPFMPVPVKDWEPDRWKQAKRYYQNRKQNKAIDGTAE